MSKGTREIKSSHKIKLDYNYIEQLIISHLIEEDLAGCDNDIKSIKYHIVNDQLVFDIVVETQEAGYFATY